MISVNRTTLRQRGVVLPLVVIGMLSLLAMAGLALDVSMAYLAKTRVQNALDAAALSAAKTLKAYGGNSQRAAAAAAATFEFYTEQVNFAAPRGSSSSTPRVEFSSNKGGPYSTSGATTSKYVRVSLASVPVQTYLTAVLPGVGDRFNVAGSAVAGPLAGLVPDDEVCGLVPLILEARSTTDKDCSDDDCFGFSVKEELTLTDPKGNGKAKGPPTAETSAKGGNGGGNNGNGGGNGAVDCSDLGAECTNISVYLGDSPGKSDAAEIVAGSEGCMTVGSTVPTENGNSMTQIAAGLNSRFGDPGHGLSDKDYPADVITEGGLEYYKEYLPRLAEVSANASGVPRRRVIAVAFGEPADEGDSRILGFGCLFLIDPVDKGGNATVSAEFITDCSARGLVPAETPGPNGFFEIILFKDPNGTVS